MLRKLIFKDIARHRQLTLPVTPQSFTVQTGRNIRRVAVQDLGEVSIAGEKILGRMVLECLFPANGYSFGGASKDPYEYVAEFERWTERKSPVRLIITGTPINRKVLVESIEYGERDGTNDVYATIVLAEFAQSNPVETLRPPAANKPRVSGPGPVPESGLQVLIKPGDSKKSLDRQYLGTGATTGATGVATAGTTAAQKLLDTLLKPGQSIYYKPGAGSGGR